MIQKPHIWSSLFITHFTNLNTLDIGKNMLPQHSQKPFSLYELSSKYLVGVKKFFAQHQHSTISRRSRIALSKYFESKCLYISVYLCKKIFIPET